MYCLSIFRNLLAYVYIPVRQKELDAFNVSVWSNYQTRKQKDKVLPAGVPEHIYSFSDQYGDEKCSLPITEEQLKEVAQLSDVLNGSDDYLDNAFRHECERHIPNTDDIEPAEAANAFLFLKSNFDQNRVI